MSTPMNDDGGGNVIYLDRHDVNCGTGAAISKVRLQREWPSGKKYRYDYTCSKVAGLGACVNHSTNGNEDGGGNMVYLDRHDVKCKPGEVLTRFKVNRPTDKTIRYDYTCCAR
jgi:hypothetical protein